MNAPRRAVLSAAGLALTTGCIDDQRAKPGEMSGAQPSSTGSPERRPRSPSVTDISLLLNWKPSGLHVPYYVAMGEGYYEAQGLSLTDVQSGQGSDFSAKQAGLGNTAFAVTSADQVLNVNSRDLSPISVGVVMQKSPVVVFTVRENFDTKFTSVEQLRGKTLGTGPGMVRILSTLLLKREDVLDAVDLVDTGYDTVQQLLSGEIDAAGGVFGDAIDARYHGYTTDVVRVASMIPTYGHVITTEGSFAREHPETVRAFLRATARGAAWAAEHPEAAIDYLVEAVPLLSESRARQRDKWRLMASEFVLSETVRRKGWGWSVQTPWQTMHEALLDAGLLGGHVDPADVWTNEYLDTEYEYIGSYADSVTD